MTTPEDEFYGKHGVTPAEHSRNCIPGISALPTPARDVFPGEDWAFHNHRTLAEVATQGRPGIARPDVARRMTRRITIARAAAKIAARSGEIGRVCENQMPDGDFDAFLNDWGY